MSLTRAAFLLLAAPGSALRTQKQKAGSPASTGYIVTLGDSYASGTGIHRHLSDYHEGDTCCRDFERTPGGELARREGKQHLMPACAGDQVPQIRDQFANLQADYPEEAARGWAGSTMMLTIGGNDVRSHGGDGWAGILVSCIISFYTDCHKKHDNQVANWDTLQADLEDYYGTMAQGASNATIRVWGYPRLLQRSWHCIPIPGVNSGATRWMDNMVDEMNAMLLRAVMSVKASHPAVDLEFVPVVDYLTTGACSLSGVDVHGIRVSWDTVVSPQTFHPSQKGYNGYYNALANNLGSVAQMDASPGDPLPWHLERIFQGWDSDEDGKLDIGDVLSMVGDDVDPKVSKQLRALFREVDKDQDEHLGFDEFKDFLPLVDKIAV